MQTIICNNYQEVSAAAAKIIMKQIDRKPDCVLGLATGSTPEGTYRELIRAYREGNVSFAQVRTVNLDEYCPIRPSDPQSYRYFMNTKLFNHVDIDKANTYVPDGMTETPEKEGERYEKIISDLGGIDLQLLGVGRNGHIGFNEPGDELFVNTHLTDLSAQTIAANARFFASEKDVPRQALTMGMSSILKSRKILLLACGSEKQAAIRHILDDKITTQWPASMLALHPDVTVICDRAAIGE